MIVEWVREIMSGYAVPLEFMYRLPSDGKCISCPSPMEVAMCKETFQARFPLLLYLFIEWLLARYDLVTTQIHRDAWRAILSFLIKCAKVRLEPQMRTYRLILALKANSSNKSIIYTSYRSNALAPLTSESLHRWSKNFFFIHHETGS